MLKMKGFSLLDISVALAVSGVIALTAMPSMLSTMQRSLLQKQVNSLEHGLLTLPAMPLDASWNVSGNLYTKTFGPPTVGTLSVTAPTTAGGEFTCAWSGQPLTKPRC